MARNSIYEKGRKYFGAPPQQRVGPPRGSMKAFTYAAGTQVLCLGGAPLPDLIWQRGHGHLGQNLGLRMELWLKDYDPSLLSSIEGFNNQLVKQPAWLAVLESDGDIAFSWLQGKPWDPDEAPVHSTMGGLYLVSRPSNWELTDSNIGWTAQAANGKVEFALEVLIASFEYLLSRSKPEQCFEDEEGEYVGLWWEYTTPEGTVAVTLQQYENSQQLPPMEEVPAESEQPDSGTTG